MAAKPFLFPLIGVLLISSTGHSLTPVPEIDTFYTSYWNLKTPNCLSSHRIAYPKNISDIQDILEYARTNDIKVKAFGQRHSSTDIICTNGIPVSMTNITHFSYNPQESTVTVGAGMSLGNLGRILHQNNIALRCSTPAYFEVTVGGALGTGAHGSSIKQVSGIYPLVTSLRVINADGSIVTISGDNLKYYRVHLGLLGIIYEVTLKVVPDFKVKMMTYNVPSSDLLSSIPDGSLWKNKALNSDSLTIFWAPSRQNAVFMEGTFYNDTRKSGTAFTNFCIPPVTNTFGVYSNLALENGQKLELDVVNMGMEETLMQATYTQIPDFAPIFSQNGISIKNPAVGFVNDMVITGCKPGQHRNIQNLLNPWNCFWDINSFKILDSEIVIGFDNMSNAFHDIKAIYDKSPIYYAYYGILLRFSGGTDTLMGNPFGRNSVVFEFFTFIRDDRYNDSNIYAESHQAIMQTLMNKYGGRSHWGKSGLAYHTKEMLQSKFPQENLIAFTNKMNEVDPTERFMNKFGKRLTNIDDAFDKDPAVTRCALYDDCICKIDSDCAETEICEKFDTDFPYYACRKNPREVEDR